MREKTQRHFFLPYFGPYRPRSWGSPAIPLPVLATSLALLVVISSQRRLLDHARFSVTRTCILWSATRREGLTIVRTNSILRKRHLNSIITIIINFNCLIKTLELLYIILFSAISYYFPLNNVLIG